MQNSVCIIKNGNTKNYKSVELFKQWTIWSCCKKWYVIDCQIAKDKYNSNNSSLCDYSDPFVLVTGIVTVNTADLDGNNRCCIKELCNIFYMQHRN